MLHWKCQKQLCLLKEQSKNLQKENENTKVITELAKKIQS